MTARDDYPSIAHIGFWPDSEHGMSAHEREAEAILNEVDELRAEVARHHRDFERWETMADKGAAHIDLNRQLQADVDRLKALVEALGGKP